MKVAKTMPHKMKVVSLQIYLQKYGLWKACPMSGTSVWSVLFWL